MPFPPRRSKYGAVRVKIDNIWFGSGQEGRQYVILKVLHLAGEITTLIIHPRFELIPKPHRIVYEADFDVIWKDGTRQIQDVKGYPTPEFRLKEKLFRWRYPELDLRILT